MHGPAVSSPASLFSTLLVREARGSESGASNAPQLRDARESSLPGKRTVLGLLGGIGAGKSYVARRIADLAPTVVVDADALAHDALDATARDGRLVAALGPAAVDAEGRPDRAAIANLVFADADLRRRLEELVHPPVLERIEASVARHQRGEGPPVLVLDVPLLIESGLHRHCDVLVFVDADDALRRTRAEARGLAADAWRRREAAQLSPAKKRVRADAVVRSDDRVDERLLPLLRDLGVLDGSHRSSTHQVSKG